MNVKRVYNKNLVVKQDEIGNIEILKFNETNLRSLNWIDTVGYPTEVMEKFLIDIENIAPTMFENGVKYWDIIRKSLSFYNNFFECGDI